MTGFEEQLGNPGQVLQPPTSSCSKAVRLLSRLVVGTGLSEAQTPSGQH